MQRLSSYAGATARRFVPICLQPIAWPAELSVGTRVTVHGLKKATNRNGDQGVVEHVGGAGYAFGFASVEMRRRRRAHR